MSEDGNGRTAGMEGYTREDLNRRIYERRRKRNQGYMRDDGNGRIYERRREWKDI